MNDENNFENVMNRIKSLIKSNKDSDLALSLGLSSSGYANAKKRQVLPFDKIFDFSNSRNVNMDWLLTGEGTMLKGGGVGNESFSDEDIKLLKLIKALAPEQKNDTVKDLEKFVRWNKSAISHFLATNQGEQRAVA